MPTIPEELIEKFWKGSQHVSAEARTPIIYHYVLEKIIANPFPVYKKNSVVNEIADILISHPDADKTLSLEKIKNRFHETLNGITKSSHHFIKKHGSRGMLSINFAEGEESSTFYSDNNLTDKVAEAKQKMNEYADKVILMRSEPHLPQLTNKEMNAQKKLSERIRADIVASAEQVTKIISSSQNGNNPQPASKKQKTSITPSSFWVDPEQHINGEPAPDKITSSVIDLTEEKEDPSEGNDEGYEAFLKELSQCR